MSDIKLKPVQFNMLNSEDESLIKAINESGFNFSAKTKMMWEELLSRSLIEESKFDFKSSEYVATTDADFSKGPVWAKWWAMDFSGNAHWFSIKPRRNDKLEWVEQAESKKEPAPIFNCIDNWMFSLVGRDLSKYPMKKQAKKRITK